MPRYLTRHYFWVHFWVFSVWEYNKLLSPIWVRIINLLRLGYNKRQGQGTCTLSVWLFFSYVIALLLPSVWGIHNGWYSSLWTWTVIYTISSSGSQALGLRLKLCHQHFGWPACRWHIKRKKEHHVSLEMYGKGCKICPVVFPAKWYSLYIIIRKHQTNLN